MEAHEALPWTSSSAPSLTSSERAQTIAEISISDGVTTCTPGRLRNDLTIASWSSWATTISGACLSHASTSAAAALVEGLSKESSARIPKLPSSACADNAARNAALRSLRLTFATKLLRTANATPPPVQCGARVDPARARPVPFWRQGFERPPATSPRLLTPRVADRLALCSARTASWTRCGLTSAPKTPSSSVRSFAFLPVPSRTGALGAATAHLLPHLDQTVLRPGDGALDEQQVLLGVDRVDGQTNLRDALAAEPPGHLDPFEDARRRRR